MNARFAICLSLFVAVPNTTQAQQLTAKQLNRAMVQSTITALEKYHATKRELNLGIGCRWLSELVDTLDPMKMYFLTSDVDEFGRFAAKHVELARRGDMSVIKLITARYRDRVASVHRMINVHLNANHDFDIDEFIDKSHRSFASDKDQLDERWRLRIKYELLVERSGGSSDANAKNFLRQIYDAFSHRAESMDTDRAIQIYLNALANIYDSHTTYLSPDEFSRFFGRFLKQYTIGLRLEIEQGRFLIDGILPEFCKQPFADQLPGCQLLAIRTPKGNLHGVHSLGRVGFWKLIDEGLEDDEWITLELFDENRLRRFSVKWPRRER